MSRLPDLLNAVFALQRAERWLTLLVDLPDDRCPDHPAWADRRALAGEWFETLMAEGDTLPFESIVLCSYRNVHSNNNDLPSDVTIRTSPGSAPHPSTLEAVLTASSVVIALTEFSATAPLKLLAKQFAFRGATMPGFSRAMLPALELDYTRVNARVHELKERMDRAELATVDLEAEGVTYRSVYDLRFRTGHASGGLLPEIGMVGNLPSGEAYIVPYEGEQAEESLTAGELPVQFGDELVVYRLERNRAVEVLTRGTASAEERERLSSEPAYGNIAELGLGVLGEWGVEAVGSVLLDEKLGLHIAFGRSDHFGGATGPAAFHDPERVIHIDRVYVPSTQPLVRVLSVEFVYGDGNEERIMEGGRFVV